jgi:hypothetical protein
MKLSPSVAIFAPLIGIRRSSLGSMSTPRAKRKSMSASAATKVQAARAAI